jgi:hypothetical protein
MGVFTHGNGYPCLLSKARSLAMASRGTLACSTPSLVHVPTESGHEYGCSCSEQGRRYTSDALEVVSRIDNVCTRDEACHKKGSPVSNGNEGSRRCSGGWVGRTTPQQPERDRCEEDGHADGHNAMKACVKGPPRTEDVRVIPIQPIGQEC